MVKLATSSSPYSKGTCTINGRVVRSMGIQRFLDNCESSQYSNIDFFASQQKLEHRWNECNMGCHYPGYRVLHRKATYSEFINFLTKIDPTKGYTAGLVDGALTTTARIAEGTVRTGEGLGMGEDGRVAEIGIENSLAFHLAKDTLTKAFTRSLDLVDNPFTSLIIKILTYYINYIPDEVVIRLAVHGKYKNIQIDANLALEASVKGLTTIDIKHFAASELKQVGAYLKNNPQFLMKQIGKYQGRKLATLIATHIAISIAKNMIKLLKRSALYRELPRDIVPGKYSKNLAGFLVFLLKTQGLLQEASMASHRLHNRSPKLWQFLRSKGGLDLIYYFVEDYLLKEYVDRIGLAERNP